MGLAPANLESVCVFCGSSDAADPPLLADAARLGRGLAAADLTLIYGGGGVGLMGACAIAAHEAGGRVLGVIPHFLKEKERRLDVVETVVVSSMHERKQIMFERSDAFVVLPGGIGTLEEVVELLSWRRLDLHAKPVVFFSPNGFWEPLFQLFQHTVDHQLTPASFMQSWISVERIEDVIPALVGAPGDIQTPAVAARMT
ncbi:TIGR00730 family Rossman fold protein [Phenylobacterium sp.]|uniref:LOG family protein n=1 Tax=Phenylobacterium sp. TaxID=1871053 RepID=UPI0027329A2B|nr:TIGR00730 family Rossman fold protein [Phenylobacterium sp.]MDP3854618.1 TIGR00730 family Rossman fold protein [Phenylobacterium sp.]